MAYALRNDKSQQNPSLLKRIVLKPICLNTTGQTLILNGSFDVVAADEPRPSAFPRQPEGFPTHRESVTIPAIRMQEITNNKAKHSYRGGATLLSPEPGATFREGSQVATTHTTRTRHAFDSAVPELPTLLATVGIDQRARVRDATNDGVLRLAYAPADSSAGESANLLPLYSPRNASTFTLPPAAGAAILRHSAFSQIFTITRTW
ncbi:MAG: hypothetical protein AW10_01136 [Candidatus Accumulibacter appositus]|uniref:Uncharacterized protein n=1 Tax=Candidatus Accumulibacter appositus TaxID=1454003 RepID=A0A011QRU8_9PROT|nr:MAG: hypothetical protein AW10_01136 [Candidatus Accumulibacter appositus]